MALDAAKIKAILFDIDGTLSDTDDQMMKQAERILSPLRLFLDEKKRQAIARWLVMTAESPGNAIYNLADRFDLDSLFIKLLDWRARSRKHKLKEYWLIPGVGEMLKTLAEKYPLGIVSARDERSSLAFINQFGFGDLFEVVVTSQSVRHTKPFPDPMLYAAEKLAIAPGKLPDGGRYARGYPRGAPGRDAVGWRAVRLWQGKGLKAGGRGSDPEIFRRSCKRFG